MAKRCQFDLIVLGADIGGLAAAACAAQKGARCAVVRLGVETPPHGSTIQIPNFVWRDLELFNTGLTPTAFTARVSLGGDGAAMVSYEDQAKTADALSDQIGADAELLEDFYGEMKGRLPSREKFCDRAEQINAQALSLDGDIIQTDSLLSVLDDYFSDPGLKRHYAAIAALSYGLGGEEPGSVQALAESVQPSSWRITDGDLIYRTFDMLREQLGVPLIDARIDEIRKRDGGRFVELTFHDESERPMRSRAVMVSSAKNAMSAGIRVKGTQATLSSTNAAEALISVRLNEEVKPPANAPERENAVYYAVDGEDEIRKARDAVLEGRMPDVPPLVFELGDKEILVRAPYCPRVFLSEEGEREWTGQDRQLLGNQVLQRLGKYLNGALKSVQHTDVVISGAIDLDKEYMIKDAQVDVPAPPAAMNEIAAAAELALELVNHG